MVNGDILKKIVKFAIPCIWVRIIQNIYPLMDSLVVGKILNLESISAVGISGSLYALFNDTIIGLVSGFGIVAGKKYGAKATKDVTAVFYNSLFASTVLCVIVAASGIIFSRQMLSLLDTPENLMQYAKEYCVVLFIGFVPNMLYNFMGEMLRAVGNSKMPLFLLIVSFSVHLILLYPLTQWFGVRGTAFATVISYVVTVIYGAVYIHRKIPEFKFSLPEIKFDYGILKECFRIGVPMGLTSFVVMFGVLILSFVTNNIGTEHIAAYSCASKIGYIITTPIFGFATALAVFTSQNFGAKNFGRIQSGIRKTLKLIFVVDICIAAVVLVCSKPLLWFLLNGNNVAVDAGYLYILIRCMSMFFLTPAAVYKNVLPAIDKPLFSTLSGFLEIGIRFLVPLLLSQALGFSVVPLTDTFTWCMLAVLLTVSYNFAFKKYKKGGNYNEKQIV